MAGQASSSRPQSAPCRAAHCRLGTRCTQRRSCPGTFYVAPPDTQLTLKKGLIEVMRGPKENGHRPSVDALFRTASIAYGPRVIGVVLSGYQDCGTAGMLSIKARSDELDEANRAPRDPSRQASSEA